MTDWAKELGHKVINLELQLNEVWKKITTQTDSAIAELDAVLREKSTLKLSASHTHDQLEIKSDRGLTTKLVLNRLQRTIQTSGNFGNGIFYVQHQGDQLLNRGQNPAFGVAQSTSITVDEFVKRIITALVDVK